MRRMACLLCVCLAFVNAAYAGTRCGQKPASARGLADAAATAMRVVRALDESGAPVALVSRVGTDLSKQGLVYSHVGFVLRDHPDGRWTVVHLLNECGTAHSNLHAEGLVNFFADDLVRQDARVTWLQPALARRLAARLAALPGDSLHQPAYNLIARPDSGDYQNSTAWVIEIVGASLAQPNLHSRGQTQAWLRGNGFAPDSVHIAYGKRLLGGLFGTNTIFTDHPVSTRLSGDYPVVTVRSILRYLQLRAYTLREAE
ncbi:MAG: DUF2145 domain-containing protein, partial [Proteobacteria bacterium]